MKRTLLILLALCAMAAASARKLPWFGVTFAMVRQAPGRTVLHVQRVVPGGPSDKAGLKAGDMITSFNRVPVGFGDELDLLQYLGERRIGERLACAFSRTALLMTDN